MSVGQGLKVVVGAGFSKSEERSLDCRGRRVGWGWGAGLGRAGSNLRGTMTTV